MSKTCLQLKYHKNLCTSKNLVLFRNKPYISKKDIFISYFIIIKDVAVATCNKHSQPHGGNPAVQITANRQPL